MNNELISIIIPVYNAEKYIENTIKNIKKQTYKKWEIILVNDKSTDKSKEIIEKYLCEQIKLIDLNKNSGPAIARNVGLEKAKGKYITFQDADDFWSLEKLEKQYNFMKTNNCAFSFTGYQFTDENGAKTGKKVNIPLKMNYEEALKNTTISTITVMFDITKINKELLKMPNVKNEDTATWWNILRHGYNAYGINEILAFYRRSEGTRSSNKFISIKNTWNLYRKQEGLSFFKSMHNFISYIKNAIKRRL